jgi:hypothetical protein
MGATGPCIRICHRYSKRRGTSSSRANAEMLWQPCIRPTARRRNSSVYSLLARICSPPIRCKLCPSKMSHFGGSLHYIPGLKIETWATRRFDSRRDVCSDERRRGHVPLNPMRSSAGFCVPPRSPKARDRGHPQRGKKPSLGPGPPARVTAGAKAHGHIFGLVSARVNSCPDTGRDDWGSWYPTHSQETRMDGARSVCGGYGAGRFGFAVSHPSRKSKDAAKMGHPAMVERSAYQYRSAIARFCR